MDKPTLIQNKIIAKLYCQDNNLTIAWNIDQQYDLKHHLYLIGGFKY